MYMYYINFDAYINSLKYKYVLMFNLSIGNIQNEGLVPIDSEAVNEQVWAKYK